MCMAITWGVKKSGACRDGSHTVSHAEKKFLFGNNQIQSSGKGGYQTQSGGTDRGKNRLLILQSLASMRVSSDFKQQNLPSA